MKEIEKNKSQISADQLSMDEFCSLYADQKDRLYRYALYRLGNPDDAEDAVSECVMAAWKSRAQLRSRDSFAAWIFGILRNCCNAQIKKEIKKRELAEKVSAAQETFDARAGADLSDTASLSIELTEALNQLAGNAREIVLLSVIGGMSSSEIAGITGLTAGSVRSVLSRSLAKMREFLS